jgi:putative Mn2+ efflux pump MntP
MGLPEIVLIAVGLSMDAFAVSITLGLSVQKPKLTHIIMPGLYFGLFQALMPFTGYFAGVYFARAIRGLDHWVAFALLGCTGGKMIKDSFSKNEETLQGDPFNAPRMLLLAVATSIDALAAGITFAFFAVNIFQTIAITGLTTFCISACGVLTGNVFGSRFKAKAEFAGGTALVLLGIKILLEHLFFGS